MIIEPGISSDIDAEELTARMERPDVCPNVGSLAEVVLAVRTLEPLRCAALVSKMADHVTAVFVAAVAVGTRVPVHHENFIARVQVARLSHKHLLAEHQV